MAFDWNRDDLGRPVKEYGVFWTFHPREHIHEWVLDGEGDLWYNQWKCAGCPEICLTSKEKK